MRIYGQDYHGFVYIWFDRAERKFGIGSHMGPIDDGYISETGWLKDAYKKRPSHFLRRILHWHSTRDRDALYHVEQQWLNLIPDELLGNSYYNLTKIAKGGGWPTGKPRGPMSEKQKRQIAETMTKIKTGVKRGPRPKHWKSNGRPGVPKSQKELDARRRSSGQ